MPYRSLSGCPPVADAGEMIGCAWLLNPTNNERERPDHHRTSLPDAALRQDQVIEEGATGLLVVQGEPRIEHLPERLHQPIDVRPPKWQRPYRLMAVQHPRELARREALQRLLPGQRRLR